MSELAILVGKDGRPSMKGTYAQMKSNSDLVVRRRIKGKKGTKEYFRVYIDNNIESFGIMPLNGYSLNNKIVVRWGNTIEVNLENSIVYNKAKNISLATNKKLSREIFMEKGVNCPKLVEGDNTVFPVIARPFSHSKGRNFVVINSREELRNHINSNQGWYYSEYINKDAEFRLHVAHGRILNYLEKPKPENTNQLAWNRARNEDPFVNVKWSDYNVKVCQEAIKALKALDLDFGGVDVMIKDGIPYVLEVNTAATLASSDYSMQRYAKYFDWLAKSETRREHHEFKEFKKASNYAWHNYHFEDREPNSDGN